MLVAWNLESSQKSTQYRYSGVPTLELLFFSAIIFVISQGYYAKFWLAFSSMAPHRNHKACQTREQTWTSSCLTAVYTTHTLGTFTIRTACCDRIEELQVSRKFEAAIKRCMTIGWFKSSLKAHHANDRNMQNGLHEGSRLKCKSPRQPHV